MKLTSTLAMAVMALGLSCGAALAHPGVTTGTVNMRIGPGTQHPVLVAVPTSQPIVIMGCLPGMAWCDVVWAGHRGWVYARYIHYAAPGYVVPIATVHHRIPMVSPWVEAWRDARVQYRVHRRMDRRWDRWVGN
ncbi:SH3 domain-containing protein [Roseococcus thiosulfatophilus]|uniref:SH3 domain-containing protein n=1 Tax=Roseococcus thiosulfatophilus TaxID=35813 RepID=UPI001A8D2B6F|nr:SH3 domain-containing protein [Roseococcus thiosulfatophilus]